MPVVKQSLSNGETGKCTSQFQGLQFVLPSLSLRN
jgi:hypothetical protein